jgi:hypothetical protein
MDGNFGRVAALAHMAMVERLKATDPQLFALSRGVLHIVVEGVPLDDVLRMSPWAVAIEATRLAAVEACVLNQRDLFGLLVAEHLARGRIGQSAPWPVRSLREVFAEHGVPFPPGR